MISDSRVLNFRNRLWIWIFVCIWVGMRNHVELVRFVQRRLYRCWRNFWKFESKPFRFIAITSLLFKTVHEFMILFRFIPMFSIKYLPIPKHFKLSPSVCKETHQYNTDRTINKIKRKRKRYEMRDQNPKRRTSNQSKNIDNKIYSRRPTLIKPIQIW